MKFLVVGLGSIGMRHAKNLLAMGHEVYGFDMDKSRYEATGIKKEPNELTRYDGHIICSPTSEHMRHLWNAVSNNTHVFVEKPIADKMDGLAAILADATKKNLVVMVGNNLRFNREVRSLKRILDGKNQVVDDGRPLCANITLSQHNTKYTDHVILNWGAHELDLALYLLGPAKVVSCVGNREIADIVLRHDSGCQTHVHVDYLAKDEIRQGEIICERNNLYYAIEVCDQDYVDEMQAFIDRINSKEENIGATGEDGLATLKIIEDAMEMAK